ncbi:hypothetical protein JSY36_10270 [Bacillus sp. H-16]|uniref:hypothetical protein n=1 Tax=Alteribacter salitolerans TaxID=2912333 RepID=UPI0019647087|nr:hypothetical protein [Alteribacter salitolerans]MBM7096142.1 hypothetical protein [Alteribacter salitolerans]
MKRTWFWTGALVILFAVTMSFLVYDQVYGKAQQIEETVQLLEKEMEQKYQITIAHSNGFYSRTAGYGATITTSDGVVFESWKRPGETIDRYLEEVWRERALQTWVNERNELSHVASADINVNYRDEAEKDPGDLGKPVEDMKEKLWLTIYIDLAISFDQPLTEAVENEIYSYWKQLQKEGADGVELIVRFKGTPEHAYMIVRDGNGKLPPVTSLESVSETLNVFK